MVSNKECCNAWLKLEKSGCGWFTVAHILGVGGGGGEVAHLTQNNVAFQKVLFSYSRNGFELSLYFKNSFVSY